MDLSNNASGRRPRVLVLLAVYNGEPWLDEQLRSICAQEGVDVRIVASDHGSTDGTLSLLDRWRADRRDLGVLPGAAAGRGAAQNFLRLLREVRLEGVDYVALADQDDVWLPGKLDRAVSVLRTQRAASYSSDAVAFWPDGRRERLHKSPRQRRFDYLLEPAGAGCTYVMTVPFVEALRAELLRDPFRFDSTSYHDWLIYAFARTHGHAWVIDDHVGLNYRQHQNNDVGANVGLGGIRRRWKRSRSGLFRSQVLHIAGLWPEQHRSELRRLERFRLLDRLALALRVRRLRRRPKDQLALFWMLVLGVLA